MWERIPAANRAGDGVYAFMPLGVERVLPQESAIPLQEFDFETGFATGGVYSGLEND